MRQVRRLRADAGFTLIELLITMFVLLVVSGLVVGATMDLARLGQTMTNRADMHSGLRNATALLQQEVGQAGRVSMPGTPTLTRRPSASASPPSTSARPPACLSASSLTIDTGANEETVTLTAVDTVESDHRQFRARAHRRCAFGCVRRVFGRHHSNHDGQRVNRHGAEDSWAISTPTATWSTWNTRATSPNRRLSRNMMAYDAAGQADLTIEQVLLDNLLVNPANPDGTVPPCFTYQERTFARHDVRHRRGDHDDRPDAGT